MGKMIESDGGKKNAQGLMITIRIVNFPLVSQYGTYPAVLLVLIPPQYMERDGRNLS